MEPFLSILAVWRGSLRWKIAATIVVASLAPMLILWQIAGPDASVATAGTAPPRAFQIAVAGPYPSFWGPFVTSLGLAVALGVAMSSFIARRIERLTRIVSAVAAGDFRRQLPVRGHDELDRLALAFNDVTCHLQDYSLLQARMHGQERSAMRGEVAARFAHEVRNPLGIIKATAELVGCKSDLTDVDKRRLGYVADEVRRIDRLIQDFLVFAGPIRRISMVRASSLLERAVGLCQDEIERHGVALDVMDRSDGACVSVDLDQMAQAFLNLVLNALDAMGEAGGRLAIAIEPPRGDKITFVFKDSGSGIPPELLPRIFDPFMTTKANGTGLGLTTVFSIVDSHAGWIEAKNRRCGGAVFELTLPITSNWQAEPILVPAPQSPPPAAH